MQVEAFWGQQAAEEEEIQLNQLASSLGWTRSQDLPVSSVSSTISSEMIAIVSSLKNLIAMASNLVASLLLVAMPGAPSSDHCS